MGLWLLQQTRKSFQQKGSACEYDELIKLALKSKEFVSILNPDDASFLNPPDMPDAIRAFCRTTHQPVPQTQGEFARCILESLALKYKAVLENITAVTGTSIEQLHVVGGGSKNELLNQFTADACGIPVIAGPVEATAIGNVLVQAIAKKKIESIKSGREIIAHSFPMKTFLPAKTEQWNEVFRKYQSLFI
jgi:rhamnulokinase